MLSKPKFGYLSNLYTVYIPIRLRVDHRLCPWYTVLHYFLETLVYSSHEGFYLFLDPYGSTGEDAFQGATAFNHLRSRIFFGKFLP